MALFFIIFFTLYSAVNFYIFIRGWQALNAYSFIKPFYTVIFIIAAASYILSRALHSKLPPGIYDVMLAVGSFWFAYILYLFLGIIIVDIIRMLNLKFNFYPSFVKSNYEQVKFFSALLILFISSITILLGHLNTKDIVVRDLNITLPKKNSPLEELSIAFFTDSHISPLNKEQLLIDIVNRVNSLNPDIILIAGDVVDDAPDILRVRSIGDEFKGFNSKYGVYASTGNHEFINEIDSSENYLEEIGIKVLRDTAVFIDNSFYLIARDDTAKINFTKSGRKSLEEIVAYADPSFPLILLDHTPFNLGAAEKNGIDLQLSGHTHHGQLWPLNYITSIVYELSWGYLKKGNSNYYVSSGVGTWGPPVRTGSKSEIVNIKIKFE
jgi:uncharacterized protein